MPEMPEPEQPIAERKRALCAGLMFSVCMTLAFPPIGWSWFAVLAIIPLVRCAACTSRPWRTALFAGLGSAPFWAFEHRWLIDVTMAGYPAIVVYLSLFSTLFVWVLGRFGQRYPIKAWPVLWLAVAPIVWVGIEVLRSRVLFHGYPWFRISQASPEAANLASVIGASGVSWMIAFYGVLFGNLLLYWRRFRVPPRADRPAWRRSITAFVVVFLLFNIAIMLSLTLVPQGEFGIRQVNVGVLQTNVPQSNKIRWSPEQKKADFDRFIGLTREAAQDDGRLPVDLIVWPETMFPGLALDPDAVAVEREARLRYPDGTPTTYFHDTLLELQRELGIPMLIGALGVDGLRIGFDDATGAVSIEQDALYNSVFLITGGAVSPTRYDKLHLTPFGEVMPYISASDWLEEKLLAIGAKGMSFGLDAGTEPVLFEIPDLAVNTITGERSAVRIATPVCFEGTMPQVVRRLVRGPEGEAPADLIIQLSNDGWFGDWVGGREQHRQLLAWASTQQRLPVVRAVNTGISCLIHPWGSWQPVMPDEDLANPAMSAEPWTEEFVRMRAQLPDSRERAIYLGNFIDWFTLAFTALVLILPMVHPGARRDRSAIGADGSVIGTDDQHDPEGPPHADATEDPPRAAPS